MKQVIFICLLSISLCLSAPPTPTDSAKHEDALHPTTTVPKSATVPNLPAQGAEITPAPQGTGSSTSNSTATSESNASPKDNATTLAPAPITTESAKLTSEKTPTTPSSTVSTSSPAVTVPTTVSTSAKPTTEPEHKATVTPKTPEPVPVQARGFDGASFIGGIILTLGLLAIGFMGFKYYKNQTERNYHTL